MLKDGASVSNEKNNSFQFHIADSLDDLVIQIL